VHEGQLRTATPARLPQLGHFQRVTHFGKKKLFVLLHYSHVDIFVGYVFHLSIWGEGEPSGASYLNYYMTN
jgi:hypothetical protein